MKPAFEGVSGAQVVCPVCGWGSSSGGDSLDLDLVFPSQTGMLSRPYLWPSCEQRLPPVFSTGCLLPQLGNESRLICAQEAAPCFLRGKGGAGGKDPEKGGRRPCGGRSLSCCPWGLKQSRSTELRSAPFCSGPLSLDTWFHFIWFTTGPASPIPRTDSSKPFCFISPVPQGLGKRLPKPLFCSAADVLLSDLKRLCQLVLLSSDNFI